MLSAAAVLCGTAAARAGTYCFVFYSAGGSFCDGGNAYSPRLEGVVF